LEQPELIVAVHRDYLMAGCEVITSASYQLSLPGLRQRGLSEAQAYEAIGSTVTLARRAGEGIGREYAVAASVGSYGAALADGSEFRGDYRVSESVLAEFHRPRLEALIAQGPDLIACETLPTVVEAEVLVRSLESFPDARAWLSFTARDEAHTAAGQPIERCAELANSSDAIVAVGVNCLAPALVEPLLHRLHAVTDKPLVAYPNRGEVWDAVRRGWVIGDGEGGGLATMAGAWIAAGARLLGGCCRTTPAQIAGLAEVLRGWPRPPA
jgi:homocysteine S-methyltransferase